MSAPPDNPPRLTVIGGPNGVGKSTFTAKLRAASYPLGRFLNPDDIAQTLRGAQPARELQAGRETLRQSRTLIASRTTFSRESTLSSNEILRTMQAAQAAGFTVVLYFIGVAAVETSKRRVRLRVARGGHAIPEPIQARRFAKTFTTAARAAQLTELTYFFDNAGREPRLVGLAERGSVVYMDRQTAPWIERATQGLVKQATADQAAAVAAITDPTSRAEAARLLQTIQREAEARQRSLRRGGDTDIER